MLVDDFLSQRRKLKKVFIILILTGKNRLRESQVGPRTVFNKTRKVSFFKLGKLMCFECIIQNYEMTVELTALRCLSTVFFRTIPNIFIPPLSKLPGLGSM